MTDRTERADDFIATNDVVTEDCLLLEVLGDDEDDPVVTTDDIERGVIYISHSGDHKLRPLIAAIEAALLRSLKSPHSPEGTP